MSKAKVTDLRKTTNRLYEPDVRRAYGLLESPAMRRLADRIDPSYQN